MLVVEHLRVELEGHKILSDVSLDVPEQSIVALIGRNGCGKSTALRAIMGLIPKITGSIRLFGEEIGRLRTRERAARGMAYVPQSGAIFPTLSVDENLRLGGRLTLDREQFRRRFDEVYSTFPALAERRGIRAHVLSGGQQRMLSVAMALMRDARIILLDEPSAGLAPQIMEDLFVRLAELVGPGRAMLIVEQNIQATLRRAHRVYVIRHGVTSAALEPGALLGGHSIIEAL